MSEIDPALVDAYTRAEYRLKRGFTLKIGLKSPELSAWYAETGIESCVFITAFNPASVIKTIMENDAAHKALGQALQELAAPVSAATGSDPSGEWPDEAGYAALGLTCNQAHALGRRFGQNAIVWAEADAIPRLLLCTG